VQKEIEELRGKLARMGNVNLEAIQEQDELEQRYLFLTKQRDDLTASKGHLENIIQKINRTSRDLFESTFNAVRENFQALFKKLFGGGSADMKLEEGADILDAGIEIIARPPGKEPRALTLLSGGEKTMTTVALLFAIFQAKPSPFCILDEVDAALDESNIDRFVLLLKEFVEKSQFIIVTHNKRTMSISDVMYGVTMQETGVSKKVSVRFENGAEQKVA
jgi:chromosome segregation protein